MPSLSGPSIVVHDILPGAIAPKNEVNSLRSEVCPPRLRDDFIRTSAHRSHCGIGRAKSVVSADALCVPGATPGGTGRSWGLHQKSLTRFDRMSRQKLFRSHPFAAFALQLQKPQRALATADDDAGFVG